MITNIETSTSSSNIKHPSGYDVAQVREDFPALEQMVHGKPLVYLDNAATTQKPLSVIEAISDYYRKDCSNVHRGVHALSERATDKYELARSKVKQFINARDRREIIFVRGTTEAINLVASAYGRKNLRFEDEILITAMEHHSNIVPWQILCEETGARLHVAPINVNGELIFEEFEKLITKKTKLVSMAHVSNALGSVNPIQKAVEAAHSHGIPVLVDGAQAISHTKVDVRELGCDFYAFSGHKLYGPTGIGILYGRAELLDSMTPYQSGGDMIRSVTFEKTEYNSLPYKFEAGTPDIAGAIGLGAAIDYVSKLGIEQVAEYEKDVLRNALESISEIPGVKIIGKAANRAGVISFMIDGVHPHDAGTIMDQEGIAVRAGHHCAQPVMDFFKIPATIRASFALYNTFDEVDALVNGIHRVREIFA